MTTPKLIDLPDFKTLLPWAKAVAHALDAPALQPIHFCHAAVLLHRADLLALPQPVLDLLLQALGTPVMLQLPGPVTTKMNASQALKAMLETGADLSLPDWLAYVAANLLQDEQEPAAPQGAAASGAPASPERPLEPGPEWAVLKPWVAGAMRQQRVEQVTVGSLVVGLLAALKADALAAHPAMAHLCHGHADELLFFTEQCFQYQKAVEPIFDEENGLQPADDLAHALAQVHAQELMPNLAWKWLHAAIGEANRYSRLLQVAYHEAGHAVALHVLTPETVFRTVTIQPNENAAGHVAPGRNQAFDAVYQNSLEFSQEQVVVALAGRAAEERRFGKLRADSGAANDFAQATTHAWLAITAFGLDPVFGPLNLAAAQGVQSQSPMVTGMASTGWLQDLAQQRLHTWLNWGMAEAHTLVQAHWPSIEKLAQALMAHKTLSNAEARAVLGMDKAVGHYSLSPLPAV